jgi:signal peptidase I
MSTPVTGRHESSIARAPSLEIIPSAAHRRVHRMLGLVYRLLLVVMVVLAVVVTVVPWWLQRSGAQLVTITSGSMANVYPVGSTLTIHPSPDPAVLQPHQVITFRAANGTVITHRIVKRVIDPGVAGVYYQTKGDMNRTADPDLAAATSVIGVADAELPWWQERAVSLQTPRGRLAVYGGLFAVIALGELVELAGHRRRGGGA